MEGRVQPLVCADCETQLDFIPLAQHECGCPAIVGYWCPMCKTERGVWIDNGDLDHSTEHGVTALTSLFVAS